jgi:hypothetical protein
MQSLVAIEDEIAVRREENIQAAQEAYEQVQIVGLIQTLAEYAC